MAEVDPATPSRSLGRGLVAAVVAAVATYGLAHVWQPQRIMHLATWIVIGLVLLPIAFTIGLTVVAATLSILLSLLCVPALLCGRPTGLWGLLRELWHLPCEILPALWRELRTTDRPGQFGAAAGVVVGITVFACWHGLGTQ